MVKSDDLARPPSLKQRKYKRFPLRYPVLVRFSIGEAASRLQATSENVSIGGLLVEAPFPIPRHSPVTFILTVQGGTAIHPIGLVGEGKVVRVEPHGAGSEFAIAVECDRPISQMGVHLVALGN